MKILKYKNAQGEFEDLYSVYKEKKISKDKADAVAGDIVMFDGSDKYILADTSEELLQEVKDLGHTPIGVVVIPPSHDVYGTGEGAIMSIVPMSYNTPDTGGTTEQDMYWGDTVLCSSTFNRVVTTNNQIPSTLGNTSSSNTYIPSENQTSNPCVQDENAFYSLSASTNNKTPSPFLTDGTRNPDYYDTSTSGGTANNVLSDFNGKGNAVTILSKISGDSWKTSALSNTASLYPSSACCWRFHTDGTNQGDWYLPSMGELGYVVARHKTINNTIKYIKNNWNVGVVLTANGFWSSSEYSSNYAWYVSLSGNLCYSNNIRKNNYTYHVRAFSRI